MIHLSIHMDYINHIIDNVMAVQDIIMEAIKYKYMKNNTLK